MDLQTKKAIELISKSNYIVAFTGAGISTESGIPDFRSPGGLWEKFDPDEYATYSSFLTHPEKFWSMHKELTKAVLKSNPNKAHEFLVKLERLGKLKAIITQNVDFLHSRAGNTRVLELHGSGEQNTCLSCSRIYHYTEVEKIIEKKGIPPKCPVCHGIIKPNVVLFGEPLPIKVFREASNEITQSDLLIIIGSSLTVYPAASLPELAIKSGTKVIIINKDTTRFDAYADSVIHGPAGKISKILIENLL